MGNCTCVNFYICAHCDKIMRMTTEELSDMIVKKMMVLVIEDLKKAGGK